MAFWLIAQPRAAMAAHVEQRMHGAGHVARDDDAVVRDRTREIVAGVRNLIGSPGADPAIDEEALELAAIELGIGVKVSWKRAAHPRDSSFAPFRSVFLPTVVRAASRAPFVLPLTTRLISAIAALKIRSAGPSESA